MKAMEAFEAEVRPCHRCGNKILSLSFGGGAGSSQMVFSNVGNVVDYPGGHPRMAFELHHWGCCEQADEEESKI